MIQRNRSCSPSEVKHCLHPELWCCFVFPSFLCFISQREFILNFLRDGCNATSELHGSRFDPELGLSDSHILLVFMLASSVFSGFFQLSRTVDGLVTKFPPPKYDFVGVSLCAWCSAMDLHFIPGFLSNLAGLKGLLKMDLTWTGHHPL